jgi:hypothetical protein
VLLRARDSSLSLSLSLSLSQNSLAFFTPSFALSLMNPQPNSRPTPRPKHRSWLVDSMSWRSSKTRNRHPNSSLHRLLELTWTITSLYRSLQKVHISIHVQMQVLTSSQYVVEELKPAIDILIQIFIGSSNLTWTVSSYRSLRKCPRPKIKVLSRGLKRPAIDVLIQVLIDSSN